MKNQMTAIRTRSRANTEGRVDEQVMKVGFAVVGIASLAIGVWSIACLAGGIAASGGPLALLGNWLKAITG